jgi:hypothetical protein
MRNRNIASATRRSQPLFVVFALFAILILNSFMDAKPTRNELVDGFKAVTNLDRFKQSWFSADAWVQIIKRYHGPLKLHEFEAKDLNMAVSRDATLKDGLDMNQNNPVGVIRGRKSPKSGSKTKRLTFYYACNEGESANIEEADKIWWEAIRHPSFCRPSNDDDDDDKNNGEETDANDAEPEAKRAKVFYDHETYWESGSAKKLFAPCADIEDESWDGVRDHVEKNIEKLIRATTEVNGWREIVEDKDVMNVMNANNIFCYRQRAHYLICALKRALENMKGWDLKDSATWKQCCEDSIFHNKYTGMTLATCPTTLQRWHTQFARKGFFPNPHPKAALGKTVLPAFFEDHLDAKEKFVKYADLHLATLTGEMMMDYVNDVLVDELRLVYNAEFSVSKQLSKIQFLHRLGLSARISAQTVNRWLHLLGYKRDRVRKHYYNDKHEDKSNVQYRQEFVQRYFWRERRCHRWIQVTKEESARLVEGDKVHKDFGYCYTTSDGIEMVEYHTDDSYPIFAKALKEFPKFGGNLSVRFPIGEKPLVMFGQDECIFKQFTVHSSCWVSETAGRPLMPKDDGQGVMISAFQSREWGFGFRLITEEEYVRINAKRDGKLYKDAEAAEAVVGKKPQKQPH